MFSSNSAFLDSITINPLVVCILLLWTTADVTTFGLFLLGEGDFPGEGSVDEGDGDGEEVEVWKSWSQAMEHQTGQSVEGGLASVNSQAG